MFAPQKLGTIIVLRTQFWGTCPYFRVATLPAQKEPWLTKVYSDWLNTWDNAPLAIAIFQKQYIGAVDCCCCMLHRSGGRLTSRQSSYCWCESKQKKSCWRYAALGAVPQWAVLLRVTELFGLKKPNISTRGSTYYPCFFANLQHTSKIGPLSNCVLK